MEKKKDKGNFSWMINSVFKEAGKMISWRDKENYFIILENLRMKEISKETGFTGMESYIMNIQRIVKKCLIIEISMKFSNFG